MSSKSPAPRLRATAFAPATVANVAVGFDILGFAVDGLGDRVTVERTPAPGVRITAITGPGGVLEPAAAAALPREPGKNTAGEPLLQMISALKLTHGFSISIEKGIPLGSGLGGSAASAVGAVVAANAVLDQPLSPDELIRYALEGEAIASGAKHADNVAPCLYGGLTLSWPGDEPEVVKLPYPPELICVVVHPEFRLDTRVARAALAPDLLLKTHIHQSARLALFVAGCCQSRVDWIQRGLEDVLIEPQRERLIPGFAAVKAAALGQGALGCSISGAGPSVFALFDRWDAAEKARDAMIEAFRGSGHLPARGWISPIRASGAQVL